MARPGSVETHLSSAGHRTDDTHTGAARQVCPETHSIFAGHSSVETQTGHARI